MRQPMQPAPALDVEVGADLGRPGELELRGEERAVGERNVRLGADPPPDAAKRAVRGNLVRPGRLTPEVRSL